MRTPERIWLAKHLLDSGELARSFAVPSHLRSLCVEYVSETAITRILGERQNKILAQIEKAQKNMNASGGLRNLERWEARLEESKATFEAFKSLENQ